MDKYSKDWRKIQAEKKVKLSKWDIVLLLAILIMFVLAGSGTYPY